MAPAVETWTVLGTIGLVLGTVPPVWYAITDRGNRLYYVILAAITGIAAVAYAVMSLGIGVIDAPGETTFYIARYVDWLLTTPLLLLYLAMLCKSGSQTYAVLIGLDVLVIAAGAAAIFTTGLLSWGLFALGGVAFVAIAYLLVSWLPKQSSFASDRVYAQFFKLRNITVVLWALYPVVWVFSPAGLGWLTLNTEMMTIVYLDFITKAAFVAIAVNGRAALDDLTTVELTAGTDGVESAIGAD